MEEEEEEEEKAREGKMHYHTRKMMHTPTYYKQNICSVKMRFLGTFLIKLLQACMHTSLLGWETEVGINFFRIC